MREDDLPRVLRSGTSEFAALADVPTAELIRRRGDRRRRRKLVLSGVLAFAIGAGGGGFAYASLARSPVTSTATGQSGGATSPAAGGGTSTVAPLSRPGIVAVTTDGVVQVLDPQTLTAIRSLSGKQDVVGDEIGVSPGGGTVYYAVKNGCKDDIFSVPADGSTQPVLVANGALPAVSPDGKKLAFAVEAFGGGPQRAPYGCAGGPAPVVKIMDLASSATTSVPVPGGLPVSHLSWAPSGAGLLVSAGPGGGNAGWTLSVLDTGSGAFGPALPVTGDNAAASYYREGIYLPSGALFVNLLCCTGKPVKPSSSFLLQVDAGGTVQHQVAQAFLDKDHTSLAADRTGQWLLYLSGSDLFVSAGGAKPSEVTIGLLAAAWLLPGAC